MNQNELNQNPWDEIAQYYGERTSKGGDFLRRYLIYPYVETAIDRYITPGSMVLNIGCGPGNLDNEIAGLGGNIVGVDYSHKMLQAYRSRLNGASNSAFPLQANAEGALPFEENAFQLSLQIMLLNSLSRLDYIGSETGRVLAPGGSVLLAVAHPDSIHRYKNLIINGNPRRGNYIWNTNEGAPVETPFFLWDQSDYETAFTASGLQLKATYEPLLDISQSHLIGTEMSAQDFEEHLRVPSVLIMEFQKPL